MENEKRKQKAIETLKTIQNNITKQLDFAIKELYTAKKMREILNIAIERCDYEEETLKVAKEQADLLTNELEKKYEDVLFEFKDKLDTINSLYFLLEENKENYANVIVDLLDLFVQ